MHADIQVKPQRTSGLTCSLQNIFQSGMDKVQPVEYKMNKISSLAAKKCSKPEKENQNISKKFINFILAWKSLRYYMEIWMSRTYQKRGGRSRGTSSREGKRKR